MPRASRSSRHASRRKAAYVDLDGYRNINIGSRLGFDIDDNAQFTWFSRFIDTT